jgi:hypothetical protein
MIVDRVRERVGGGRRPWNEHTRSRRASLGSQKRPYKTRHSRKNFSCETYHVRCRLVLGKYRPISWHEKRSRYHGKGGTGGGGGWSSCGCCSSASFGAITVVVVVVAAIDEEEKRWRDEDDGDGDEEEVDRDDDPEAGAAALAGREGDPEPAIGGCRGGGWLILSGRPLPSSFEEGALEGEGGCECESERDRVL